MAPAALNRLGPTVLFPVMVLTSAVYDAAVRLVRRVAPLAARGSSKLARGIRGRLDAGQILEGWARESRIRGRPLAWFHAPSVGEGLQARSSLEALLEERGDLQTAYTHFSPSAAGLARKMPVDVAGFLPWDVGSEMGRLLDVLDPSLLAFTKTEVWPGLARAAVARDVPVVLIAATLSRGAGRLRLPARALLGSTFGSLSRVLAVTDEDALRFPRLGVPEDRIVVTGDPAIDSAWSRAHQADEGAPYLLPFHADPRPTLVAGSTWHVDEEILAPALARVRGRVPELRLVVAPHEPGEDHLHRLEGLLASSGMRSRRLAEVEAEGRVGEADAVVVDRVGVLAHLYTVGTLAYVGGGFHRHGLHSVLEPAAAGLPTLFGPRHSNAWAATELARIGAARMVAGPGELAAAVEMWLLDRILLEESSGQASGYIEAHRGAADRTGRILAELLPPPEPAAGDGTGPSDRSEKTHQSNGADR
jgi:3-deoxy-D-manno-octulosonic-acid transferase